MFQNGISRNTKCTERDGFRREGHNILSSVIGILNVANVTPVGNMTEYGPEV